MISKDENALLRRFGLNLRELRLARGISQEALAASANLHRTYIGMVERGEKNVTLLSMCRLSSALAIHPSALLQEINDA